MDLFLFFSPFLLLFLLFRKYVKFGQFNIFSVILCVPRRDVSSIRQSTGLVLFTVFNKKSRKKNW